MKRVLLAAALAAFPACPPPAPPDPPPSTTYPYAEGARDGLGTPLGDLCHRLRAARCEEGLPTRMGITCYEHLVRAQSIFSVPVNCAATTPDEIRACGNDQTLKFRCRVVPDG